MQQLHCQMYTCPNYLGTSVPPAASTPTSAKSSSAESCCPAPAAALAQRPISTSKDKVCVAGCVTEHSASRITYNRRHARPSACGTDGSAQQLTIESKRQHARQVSAGVQCSAALPDTQDDRSLLIDQPRRDTTTQHPAQYILPAIWLPLHREKTQTAIITPRRIAPFQQTSSAHSL